MACAFDRTAMLHHLVAAHTTIPMPEVLAVNMSYIPGPGDISSRCIFRGRSGQSCGRNWAARTCLTPIDRSERLWLSCTRIHFPTFGELDVDGAVRGDRPYFAALTERAQVSIKNARLRDLFLSVLDEHRHLFLTSVRQVLSRGSSPLQHTLSISAGQWHWPRSSILTRHGPPSRDRPGAS